MSIQIVSKKIMIFGGLYDIESEGAREHNTNPDLSPEHVAIDSNHRVSISNVCWHLDVTTG